MNGFPLKKAIQSGAWLECIGNYFDEPIHFRIRILGFSPTSVEEVIASNPDEDLELDLEGVLWTLFLEAVNLSKKPIDPYKLRGLLKVADADGYEFSPFRQEIDVIEPYRRFSGWSSVPPLSPKLKAKGGIAFVLPDEETDYFLLVAGEDGESGSIREA